MKGSSITKYVIIGGVLCWIALFGAVPTLMLLGMSVLTPHPSDLIAPVFSLHSYARLFAPALVTMFVESLLMAGTATVLCLFVGYPFAYIVARMKKRHAKTMLLLVMIPFWTNTLIRTYALVTVLKADGILNSVLIYFGIIKTPLELMYTPIAVFIGLLYTLLPFMILPLYATIEKLDYRLLEASRDLGATRWITFRKITLPLTFPGIISGSMLVFLPALGMFYIPDVLGGARSMLLGNYIRDQFLVARDFPMGATVSIALTMMMCVMLFVYYRSVRRSGRKASL
ncbi:ABC transporter permease subunit [Desulfovibrio inopinatus]|uniref:ABC transporter permease subunit n=1 Tax=Desulfovibrio inopinatus TaxID=102109 RepID=UPI00041B384E|nr:ABC transporter permease subunit [Desulfovibrio inopinatus]